MPPLPGSFIRVRALLCFTAGWQILVSGPQAGLRCACAGAWPALCRSAASDEERASRQVLDIQLSTHWDASKA